MISLILVPVHTRPGVYIALLGGTGRVLCRSRTPIFDAARQLLADGADYDDTLEAGHEGSDCVAWRTTVGEAAKWAVEDSDRGGLRKRPWKPYSSRDGEPENALGAFQAVVIAPDPENASGDTDRGQEMQEAAE